MIFGPLLAAEQFLKTEEGGGRETRASIHRELRMSANLPESGGLRQGTRESGRKRVAAFVVIIGKKGGRTRALRGEREEGNQFCGAVF